jgi:transposase
LADRYADERRWAQTLLAHTDDLFLLWHLYRGGWIDQVTLQQALIPIRMDVHAMLQAGVGSPQPKLAAFCRDLLAQWDALWTFSRVVGMEPTNNAAERALRHAVLWRKGSFGSRSAAGCRFVERMLSVHATCIQQERALFAVVTQAVQAAWAGAPAPVLIPYPTTA